MAKTKAAPRNITLNELADFLGVHPRTAARALDNDVGAKWTPNSNPTMKVADVAAALGCEVKQINRVLRGIDNFVNQAAGADFLGLQIYTFKARKYKPVIRKRGIVRYLQSELLNEDVKRFGD